MDLPKLINDTHSSMDFGTFVIIGKKHDGRISTIDVQKIHTHKVNNNQEALAMVIQLMKSMQVLRQPGELTFTLSFNKQGETSKLQLQDLKHHTGEAFLKGTEKK